MLKTNDTRNALKYELVLKTSVANFSILSRNIQVNSNTERLKIEIVSN